MNNKFQLFLAFALWFAVSLLILFIIQNYCSRDNYSSVDKKSNIEISKTNLENKETEIDKIEVKQDFDMKYLDTKQKYISEVASYAAASEMEKLDKALNEALDNWLTINELKEALLHIYAYAGFPKSLNWLWTLQQVIKTRTEAWIEDNIWETPVEVSSDTNKFLEWWNVQTELVWMSFNYTFVPWMDAFLKEHLFADLYLRWVLSYNERELVTISALTVIPWAESQLWSHVRMWMNSWLSIEEIKEAVNYIWNNLWIDKSEVLKNF